MSNIHSSKNGCNKNYYLLPFFSSIGDKSIKFKNDENKIIKVKL